MKAHAAVAEGAYRDGTIVSAVLSDFETAPIEEPLRATLRMLCRLTREHAVTADDMRAVLAAGGSREQIEDALCPRRLLLVQHNRPAGRCLRISSARSQGL